MDFIWEAFSEWRKAARAGQAPNHQVRITHLVGTSAGASARPGVLGRDQSLPHVYHDDLLGPVPRRRPDPAGGAAKERQSALQRLGDAHHPRWPAVPSGRGGDRPDLPVPQRPGRDLQDRAHRHPAVPGRHRPRLAGRSAGVSRHHRQSRHGIPYTLNFSPGHGVAVTNEWYQAHRDNVGFAVSTTHVGGVANGMACASTATTCPRASSRCARAGRPAAARQGAPDVRRHHGGDFGHPDRLQGDAGAAESGRLPVADGLLGPRPKRGGEGHARLAAGFAGGPPSPADPLDYPATDGGLFDNKPFNLAHDRLVGVRGQNPQDGAHAIPRGDPGRSPALTTPSPVRRTCRMRWGYSRSFRSWSSRRSCRIGSTPWTWPRSRMRCDLQPLHDRAHAPQPAQSERVTAAPC